MSIKKFNLYICKHDPDKIYKPLVLYRNMLNLYLCNSKNVKIGGPLNIKSHITGGKSLVDWTETIIDEPFNTNLLIKPLHIMFPTPPGHAGLVIYDKKEMTFEYFDPNGYPPWYNSVFDAIQVYNKHFMNNYKPKNVLCPFSPQNIEQRGTCADWALLSLYLQCNDSDDYSRLKTSIMRSSPERLQLLINNFRCFLWDTVLDNKMMDLREHVNLLGKFYKNEPERFFYMKEKIYQLIADKNIPQALEYTGNILKNFDPNYKEIIDLNVRLLKNIDENKKLVDIFKK